MFSERFLSGLNGVLRENNGSGRPDVQDFVGQLASGSVDPRAAAERVCNTNRGSQKVAPVSSPRKLVESSFNLSADSSLDEPSSNFRTDTCPEKQV